LAGCERRQGLAFGGDGRIVHSAVSSGHDQHQVGVSGVELTVEQTSGHAGVRLGIVEPAVVEVVGDLAAECAGDDDEDGSADEYASAAADDERGESSEHGRVPLQYRR
jgi:hypothetical protein